MNEQIVESIEKAKNTNVSESTQSEEKFLWLVFSICGRKFAVESKQVKEIIQDSDVYPLPFVPSYIEGVLNRRGDPCAVLAPDILLELPKKENEDSENKKTRIKQAQVFLVLAIPDDQVCLHIESVLFFKEKPKSEFNAYHSNEDIEFYRGVFEVDGEEISALNIEAFEKQLKKDLGNND